MGFRKTINDLCNHIGSNKGNKGILFNTFNRRRDKGNAVKFSDTSEQKKNTFACNN